MFVRVAKAIMGKGFNGGMLAGIWTMQMMIIGRREEYLLKIFPQENMQ